MHRVLKRWLGCGILLLGSAAAACAQNAPAQSIYEAKDLDPVLLHVLEKWPEGKIDTVKNPGVWSYEQGVLLDGVAAEWRQTGDGRLFAYIKAAVDRSELVTTVLGAAS